MHGFLRHAGRPTCAASLQYTILSMQDTDCTCVNMLMKANYIFDSTKKSKGWQQLQQNINSNRSETTFTVACKQIEETN